MNVLNEVAQEDKQIFDYADEKIASDIYQVSLSYAERALDGMDVRERVLNKKKNKWLEQETDKVHQVFVLNFDNIVNKLKNGRSSCDAFFYNFHPNGDEYHYLAEMKNTNKKKIISLLNDESKDGIYNKVNDSVQMIKSQLEFGGIQEHNDIIIHTHLFIVYSGKNDVPSRKPLEMPQKTRVVRDGKGKQRRAGRMSFDSGKNELEVYQHFGDKIHNLGLASCDEKTFPGDALPRARKISKDGSKQRRFSLFSAHDFSNILDSGFFDDWNWGSYQQYFCKKK